MAVKPKLATTTKHTTRNNSTLIGSNNDGHKIDKITLLFLYFPPSRWVKNDYELVRWPPDAERDKAAGIHVAGEEEEDDTPDAAQVRVVARYAFRSLAAFCPGGG